MAFLPNEEQEFLKNEYPTKVVFFILQGEFAYPAYYRMKLFTAYLRGKTIKSSLPSFLTIPVNGCFSDFCQLISLMG